MNWYARRVGYWSKHLADPDTVITNVSENRTRVEGTRHGRAFNVKLDNFHFAVGSGSSKIRMMLLGGTPPAFNTSENQ